LEILLEGVEDRGTAIAFFANLRTPHLLTQAFGYRHKNWISNPLEKMKRM
jgi:hypothetical protein